jgi:hypothetical protein
VRAEPLRRVIRNASLASWPARRTSLPIEAIVWLITRPTVPSVEVETWFG